jgi:predicted amidophosphoribosyltransferase
MVQINPQRIYGRWSAGYALDYHMVRSEFLGYDEYGHPRFENTRSEIGELLYQLKYRNDQSAIETLADIAAGFVEQWKPDVDSLVPATPSRIRTIQPVITLGNAIAKRLDIEFAEGWIKRREGVPELKNVGDHEERIRLLKGAHVVAESKVKGRKILVFDDLLQSGSTMNAITAALYDHGDANMIFALALTRTRTGS